MSNLTKLEDKHLNERIAIEAASWVAQLDGNRLSTSDRLALAEWLARSPKHSEELNKLAVFWGGVDQLIDRALVNKSESSFSRLMKAWWTSKPQHFAAIVGAFVVVSLSLMFYSAEPYNDAISTQTVVFDVKKGQELIKILEDGSTVHLNTDTVIEVLYTEKLRTVRLLRGEVYFDVAKDHSRPFEVFVGDSHIVAVGTEFDIKLDQNKVDVVVTEGVIKFNRIFEKEEKVALLNKVQQESSGKISKTNSQSNPILVEAGFQIKVGHKLKILENTISKTVDRAMEILPLDQNKLDQQTAWRQGELLFVNSPLSEVISELGRYNNVDITIQPSLRDFKIGGRFLTTDVDRILKALEMSANIDVQVQSDGAIFLASR